MATQRDVHRIALSMPAMSEDAGGFRSLVDGKMSVWLWPERIAPKRARVPNPEVIVVRVGNVRLPLIDLDVLADVITESWRCRAPGGCSCNTKAAREGR